MNRIRFDSEPELRDQISESLSEYGWCVETEVYSVCKTGRVDLLANHPQAGTFGLEIKYMENYSGKKLGEAMKQVGFVEILFFRRLRAASSTTTRSMSLVVSLRGSW